MKYLYAAACCLLFGVLALPAFAQEAPTASGLPENSDFVEQSPATDTSAPIVNEEPGASNPTSSEENGNETTSQETIVPEVGINSTDTNTESEISTENNPEPSAIAAAFAFPTIYISEINWAGSALSSADEWIELYNPTGQSVDLGGWILAGAATGGESLALAEGTLVDPGSTLLIANYSLGEKSTLFVEPDLVTTSLSLPNTKLEIYLATPEGVVVDQIVDAGTPDAGLAQPFISMQRDLSTLGWVSAYDSVNLTNETQLGTPGAIAYTPNIPVEIQTEIEVDDQESEIEQITNIEEIVEETVSVTEQVIDESIVKNDPVQANESTEEIDETATSEPATEENADENTDENTDTSQSDVPDEETQATTTAESDSQSSGTDMDAADQPPSFSWGSLLINEFVSDPEDGVEWVEIFNPGDMSINTTGWTITDTSGKATSLVEEIILAGEFVVIENPNGKLNNSGDTITLFDPSGNIIDAVEYDTQGAPAKGESAARTLQSTFVITDSVTKNKTNIYELLSNDLSSQTDDNSGSEKITQSESDTISDNSAAIKVDSKTESSAVSAGQQTSGSTNSSVSSETKTTRIVAIADTATSKTSSSMSSSKSTSTSSSTKSASAKSSSSAKTTLTGTITATPGLFGSQIAYINGAQLYFYYADWPALQVGDMVTIQGTTSSNQGESRLKISAQSDISVTGHEDQQPIVLNVQTALMSETGTLVTIAGDILSRDGQTLVISDESGSIDVVAHANTDVGWNSLTHVRVQITGVLRQMGNQIKLYPRSMTDVVEIAQATQEDESNMPIVSGTSSGNMPWVGLGLLTVVLGGFFYSFFRSRRLIAGLQPVS